MKKFLLIIMVLISGNSIALAQGNTSYDIDFTSPESVVNAIFYAAQTEDFTILQYLCPPIADYSDGDVKDLCSLSEMDNDQEMVDGFVAAFKDGYINGPVTYRDYQGYQLAEVPFVFGPRDEKMSLVKLNGNWYLSGF